MKFACTCGAIVSDQTDFVPHKAYLLSDQDAFDAAEISEQGSSAWLVNLTRHLYECTTCGRIWLENAAGALVAFVPEGHTGRVIAPVAGEHWKAPLRAAWNDQPVVPGARRGTMRCARGTQETVVMFDDWPQLELAYHELLQARHAEGTLRDALLSRNGEIVHRWPPIGSGEA